jgi:hypothetical protein
MKALFRKNNYAYIHAHIEGGRAAGPFGPGLWPEGENILLFYLKNIIKNQ